MIEIKKAFEKLTEEELNQLLDTPVWMALLAAHVGDGKVSEDERAEACEACSFAYVYFTQVVKRVLFNGRRALCNPF